ncbi:hypothetical protein M0Q97_03540 [Candidatus Dojkabacteria bacterium]|jgi:hypothetical protein|nr:hypothetical protein [Candidatus Dojkabacteria bacterium]
MEQNIIIKNFRLNVFKNLLEQSLMTNNQLMLNISPTMFKSASFSITNTFIKLWSIPLKGLIIEPEDESSDGVINFDEPKQKEEFKFESFDCYIFKGDLFKKFLSVYESDEIDLEFVTQEINGKQQAIKITLIGNGSETILKTTFLPTTEEFISNKISDYNEIIKHCTPDKSMFTFIFSSKQIQEIKRLIKNLHKSMSDNSAFLTFMIDSENKKIIINDKVFVLDIKLSPELQTKLLFPEKSFSFNILKSDFVITGNHDFTFYVAENDPRIILGARYGGSIIWGTSTKIETNNLNINDAALDATIDNLNLEEYFK